MLIESLLVILCSSDYAPCLMVSSICPIGISYLFVKIIVIVLVESGVLVHNSSSSVAFLCQFVLYKL